MFEGNLAQARLSAPSQIPFSMASIIPFSLYTTARVTCLPMLFRDKVCMYALTTPLVKVVG